MYKFYITCRCGHGRVWGHKRREFCGVMVRAHEQITLVLISRITGCWLRRRSKPLEIEFVRVPLAVYFGHNVFVVVISVQIEKQ